MRKHSDPSAPTNEPKAVRIPDDLETLLTRDATAATLTAAGFPVTASTLATKASRGGGPCFSKWGKKPLYRWRDALEWAESRLSEPIRSTSELDFRRLTEAKSLPAVCAKLPPISGTVGGDEGTTAEGATPRSGGPPW